MQRRFPICYWPQGFFLELLDVGGFAKNRALVGDIEYDIVGGVFTTNTTDAKIEITFEVVEGEGQRTRTYQFGLEIQQCC